MSAIVNRRMSVQIIPKMSFRFPSIISAPSSMPGVVQLRWYTTFRPDVRKLHAPRSDKFEGFVHVLRFLYAHSWVLVVSPERCIPCEAKSSVYDFRPYKARDVPMISCDAVRISALPEYP